MYHPCNQEYTMPKILKEKFIFKSRLFNIKQATINFNNKTLNYEIISGTGRGAVLIVPIINDEVIFIKEYAAAVDDYMITLPKGKIDDGETLIETANRELQEEVGFKSDNITLINKIYLAPGYIDHTTHVMLATNLKPSSLEGDEPEALEQIRINYKNLDTFLSKASIVDSRVFAAVHFIKNYDK